MWIYTVYDHPTDYPDEFVIRRFKIEDRSVAVESNLFARGRTLEEVRAQLPSNLVNLRRTAGDDEKIVEVWLE